MLTKCEACEHEISEAATACPHCGHPRSPADAAAKVSNSKLPAPVFLIIAAGFLILSLWVPRILLIVPVAIVGICSAISLVRSERPRWLAVVIVLSAFALLVSSASTLPSAGGGGSNLDAAKIVDFNWRPDRSFGTKGTIHWTVAVQNTGSKPISLAKVEFSTYDSAGKVIASTYTFVSAIPPGQTRTESSFADLYGNEATAKSVLADVTFADQ